ncbi:MAG: leucine-rich repeat domain-containing protein [Roseburia sp.]
MRLRSVKKVFAGIMAVGMIASMLGMTNLVYANELTSGNESLSESGSVEINEQNFPDKAFRDYVSENFDTDDEKGVLSQAELAAVNKIVVNFKSISSLAGVEKFPNLTYLDCGFNSLTALDTSQNKNLETLYCGGNQLTELKLRDNKALTSLNCGSNQLTSLDVTGNPDLEKLFCFYNQLEELDLSENDKLTTLECGDNNMTNLSVINNPNLVELDCKNNRLSELDLSENHDLQTLICSDNRLCYLDVSGCSALTSLECENNVSVQYYDSENKLDLSEFSDLDLEKIVSIEGAVVDESCLKVNEGTSMVTYTYRCGDNNLEEFTIYTAETEGGKVNIEENFPDENFREYVKQLDLDADGALSLEERVPVKRIEVNGASIKILEGLEYFPELVALNCEYNEIETLDLSKNVKLTGLDCRFNNIRDLNVSQNDKLNLLYCDENQLSELDLSNNSRLDTLTCSYNQLKALDVTNMENLEILDCNSNYLTELDLSKNKKLCYLYCGNNLLSCLNVQTEKELQQFYCDNNICQLSYDEERKIDLEEISGFDITKISDVQRGDLVGSCVVVDEDCYAITYKYDCVDSYTCEFTAYVAPKGDEEIDIDEVNFSDNNFRAYVHEFDLDGDDKLSAAERYNVTSISVDHRGSASDLKIKTLKGLEYFPKLSSLYCSYNELTNLDLSANSELIYLDCSCNQLINLDVSQNSKLTHYVCYENQREVSLDDQYQVKLESVDVSKVSDLQGGTMNGNTLTAYAKEVTYTYDCGNEHTMEVTLICEATDYMVHFDGNDAIGGTMEDMTNCQFNSNITLTLNQYEREGYTFAGWNTSADGTGTLYTDGATINNDGSEYVITLYAQWEEAKDPVAPLDPVDPSDPVDPVNPVDPVDPVDPIEPVEPADPTPETPDPVTPEEPNPSTPEETKPLTPENGWYTDENGIKFFYKDGKLLTSQWYLDGKKWYYLNGNGAAVTGWQKIDGAWYYFGKDAVMATGWQEIDDTWYYLGTSGAMQTGWQDISGKSYYFYGNGSMAENAWVDGYYVGTSGEWVSNPVPEGWKQSGNRWWYQYADGTYAKNTWKKIGGAWYYFDASGWMSTGWTFDGSDWYYMNTDGTMKTGWLLDGNAWYYLKSSGAMATGWVSDGGSWYLMDGSGAMKTGWAKQGEDWYYMDESGVMKTGWIDLNGTWYFLQDSGVMAHDTVVDGYTLKADGAWAQ